MQGERETNNNFEKIQKQKTSSNFNQQNWNQFVTVRVSEPVLVPISR